MQRIETFQIHELRITQGAIDRCKKYIIEHIQGEKRICQYKFTQFKLADMQARVDIAHLLVYRTAQTSSITNHFHILQL